MLTPNNIRRLALSLPNVVEKPHFDRTKFRARIDFASLHTPSATANLRLTAYDQAEFSAAYPGIIYPVPNGFGRMGWTTFELNTVSEEVLWAGILAAYALAK
jgi:hypothetical protein